MTDRCEFFRDKNPDEKLLVRAETILQRTGWLPADELFIGAPASLLAGFLHGQVEPNLEVLTARAERLISRDVPTFPENARIWDHQYRDIVQQSVPQRTWVNPGRVFPNRDYKDKGDWTRSRDASPAGRDDPALGLAEFARRIAREKGDVRGLAELFGPDDNVAYVDLDGWETPLGTFFRVSATETIGQPRSRSWVRRASRRRCTGTWDHRTRRRHRPMSQQTRRSVHTARCCTATAWRRTQTRSPSSRTLIRSCPSGRSSSTQQGPPPARCLFWSGSRGSS